MDSLPYLYFELTRACNHRCLQCFNNSLRALPGELDTDETVAVLQRFSAQNGRRLQLTGGDPLMRRDFSAIMAAVRSLKFEYVILSTNGLLLSDRLMAMMDGSVNEIDLSLDGFREEHDVLRGVPCWDKSVAAIRRAVSSSALTYVCVCVSRPLLQRLEEFLDFLVGLGVDAVKLAQIGEVGRRATPASLSTAGIEPRDLYDQLQRQVHRYSKVLRIHQSLSLTPRMPNVEEDGLVCDPRGLLYPLIGHLSARWVVGRATPSFVIDAEAWAAYQQVIDEALTAGVRDVASGVPVNWWTLFHDRLEQAPIRIGR